MLQLIILSILMVLVYQYEEVVWWLQSLWRQAKHKQLHKVVFKTDVYVGLVVTMILMPMMLLYVLQGSQILPVKLLWLALIYLIFGVLVSGLEVIKLQLQKIKRLEGWDKMLHTGYLVGGLFYPPLRMLPGSLTQHQPIFASLALLLSIPPFLGYLISSWYHQNVVDSLWQTNPYFDSLIVIMVGGLFINIMVHVLEKYFKHANLSIWSYYRIVIGLALAIILFVYN